MRSPSKSSCLRCSIDRCYSRPPAWMSSLEDARPNGPCDAGFCLHGAAQMDPWRKPDREAPQQHRPSSREELKRAVSSLEGERNDPRYIVLPHTQPPRPQKDHHMQQAAGQAWTVVSAREIDSESLATNIRHAPESRRLFQAARNISETRIRTP